MWIGLDCFNTNVGLIYSYYALTDIFPEWRGILFSLAGSANALSFVLYVPYKRMSDRQPFWIVTFILGLLFLARTFISLPRGNSVLQPVNGTDDTKAVVIGWESRNQTVAKRPAQDASDDTPILSSGILTQFFNKSTVLFMCWIFIYEIHMTQFFSFLEPWLMWATKGTVVSNDTVSHYTEVYQYASMAGIVTGPMMGFGIDSCVSLLMKIKSYDRAY